MCRTKFWKDQIGEKLKFWACTTSIHVFWYHLIRVHLSIPTQHAGDQLGRRMGENRWRWSSSFDSRQGDVVHRAGLIDPPGRRGGCWQRITEVGRRPFWLLEHWRAIGVLQHGDDIVDTRPLTWSFLHTEEPNMHAPLNLSLVALCS